MSDLKVDALVNVVSNEEADYESVRYCAKSLRWLMDHAAKKLAKSNADWHDNPEAEDYAAFHAPADVQFPRKARDAAILNLIKYHLDEMTTQEAAKK